MGWMVRTSVRQAVAVLLAVALLAGIGVLALRDTSIDLLPEFGLPKIHVQTDGVGLSTDEVEQFLTVPQEMSINGVPWVDTIASRSVSGLSSIDLTFKPGTDIWEARQMVTERIVQTIMPVDLGLPPVMIQPMSSQSRAKMVGVSSQKLAQTELSALARWRIRPRLLAVPGVANVTVWGEADPELLVLVDPARMAARGITIDQMINTAGDAVWVSPLTFLPASSPGADGIIDTPNQRITVQHILPVTTPEALAAIPVEDAPGTLIGDVATVVSGHTILRGDASVGDAPGLVLVVEKLPGVSAVDLDREVDAALEDLAPGLAGVTVDADLYSPGKAVARSARTVGLALLVGFVLLVSWLGVASRSWRVALIGAVSVALSLLAVAVVLQLRGATWNVMLLAGLLVGLAAIVDDAVVGVLAVKERVEAGDTADSTRSARVVADAALEVFRPLGFAFAITLLAMIPLLFITGVTGALVKSALTSYALAVVASMLVSVIVTPSLAYLLLSSATATGDPGPIARSVERAVDVSAPAFIGRPARWVYGLAVVLTAIGIAGLALSKPGPLVPPLRDGNVLVRWQATPGTSLPEMNRVTTAAARRLREIHGVVSVSSNVGQALSGDRVVAVDSAETWIALDPKVDYEQTVASVRDALKGFPGIGHEVMTYPEQSIRSAHEEAPAALTVRLYGSDLDLLHSEGRRLRDSLAKIEGVVDPKVQARPLQPAITIQPVAEAAAKAGLKPGDIRRQMAVQLIGLTTGAYYRNQEIYDIAVWSKPETRQNVDDVRNLMLDTPQGKRVPVRAVANVSVQPSEVKVTRDRASRYVDITAGVEGGVRSVVKKVEGQLVTDKLPLGYSATVFSPLLQQRNEAVRVLLLALAAIAAAYLLLHAAFDSWSRALLVLMTAPLAAVGGVVAALIWAPSMSLGARIGLIAVVTLALRNGVLLVRRIQSLEKADDGLSGAEPVERGVREAAFPVIVTAVGLVLMIAPFTALGDSAGIEILRPLAVVVLGGLVTSTFVTLLLLPTLYVWVSGSGDAEEVRTTQDPATQGGTV